MLNGVEKSGLEFFLTNQLLFDLQKLGWVLVRGLLRCG
jgi:hypothetical protein